MPSTARLAATAMALPLVAGCALTQSNDTRATSEDTPGRVAISSTDDSCDLSARKAPSGTVTFEVTNDGSKVTEVYLYAADGKRTVAEVENVGPGLTRSLVVAAAPGTYVVSCKPGMSGAGIRTDFTVTDSGAKVTSSGAEAEQVAAAEDTYGAYVREQADLLLDRTRAFVTAYSAGRDDRARTLYPRARTHWERIETVAESFGDLDPQMDARQADLEPGQAWTGWHRMEKDLWPRRDPGYTPMTTAERTAVADGLLADTEELQGRIEGLDLTLDQIANGSRALLEEVAAVKVSGEEEHWSRTDLWDFAANVDGARVAFEGMEPILATKDADLAKTIDTRFADLSTLLDRHRDGSGFVSYDVLTRPEVKQLADAVNALSEPLSGLTAAVLS